MTVLSRVNSLIKAGVRDPEAGVRDPETGASGPRGMGQGLRVLGVVCLGGSIIVY